MSRRNRDTYQIYYNILDIARDPKTPGIICSRELTSYQHVKDCIISLREYGLIQKTNGKYQTTHKGLSFMTILDKIYQMLPWLKVEF
jgi:predicted transcriptional regulator